MEVAPRRPTGAYAPRSYTRKQAMFNLFKAVFGRSHSSEAVSKSSIPSDDLSRAEASANGDSVEENCGATLPLRDNVIELPLKVVMNGFPGTLQAQVRRSFTRSINIALPADLILERLKRGAVKLTFKQIKAMAPSEAFLTTKAHDEVLVELPLKEILARLRREHLSRRGQRTVFIPEDTPLIFGPTGSVTGAVHVSEPPVLNRASPLPTKPPEQCAELAKQAESSVADSGRLPAISSPLRLPRLDTASCQISPAKASLRDGWPTVLTIALERVLSRWPESLRGAVERVAGDDTILQIPSAEVEPGVRRGKVILAWRQVRPWIVPALTRPLDEYDAQAVELPLAEIAPIFMARRRENHTRTASLTPVDIPDLFTSSPRSSRGELDKPVESGGTVATVAFPAVRGPVNPSQAADVVTESVTLPSPRVLRSDQANVNGKADGTVLEAAKIIEQTYQLPGVSGVLLATDDGLVVAAKLPSGLAPESLAAFTPQMHQRIAQYTREIGVGSPSHLTIVVQDRPLMILKVGNGFFAAVGRPGEPLPEAQIKAYAGLNYFTPKE